MESGGGYCTHNDVFGISWFDAAVVTIRPAIARRYKGGIYNLLVVESCKTTNKREK